MGIKKKFKEYQGKDIGVLPLRKLNSIKNKRLKVNRLVEGNR